MAGARRPARLLGAVVVVLLLGIALRSLRLAWQPLWWDEGYSVYFATEPLPRMVWLTARDIHPPLYYALLHVWIALWQNAGPVVDRLLSVLFGVIALPLQFWLARILFPARRRLALVGLLLLTFSPIHLYYSQEVRMYGLALALSLASTLCFWLLIRRLDTHASWRTLLSWPAAGYALTALAGLYTLYYVALLLVAQFLWSAFHFRRRLRTLALLVGLYSGVGLAYLPWLLYAIPQLVGYVGGKVQSDQDTPLGPLAYAERHLVAFTAGHVQWPALPSAAWALAPATLAICALILGLVLQQTLRQPGRPPASTRTAAAATSSESLPAIGALWTWLLAPLLIGWLINVRLPFFPEGGERLLLIGLPYFLLLLAYGVDRTWQVWHLGKVALAALALNSLFGITAFATTPRYGAHDYRPILRQIVQQGADTDTLLAIFPWQIGYWRAYAPPPAQASGWLHPILLSDGAVDWSPAVQATVDTALRSGTVWFPEPLTFGSSLPAQLERYLNIAAVNLENRWYDATRLTAWRPLATPIVRPVGADFGPVRLVAAGIAPAAATSANSPVAISLVWERRAVSDLNVSVRIQDAQGHVWSSREYAQTGAGATDLFTETVGLIAPVGLPPGGYTVAVSMQNAAGAPLTIAGSDAVAAPVGALEIIQPVVAPSPWRLPIQTVLPRPAAHDGLSLLGFAGIDRTSPLLAGTELAATLFLANASSAPPERQIYVSLLDANGAGVAGYTGWPLPEYPTQTWPPGALVQTPVAFFVPGTLSTGDYRLVAGFSDPATGAQSPPVALTTLPVRQRTGSFTQPAPPQRLADVPQIGTHARLAGYDRETASDGSIHLQLYWEILQPLLPPHHIFVHADNPEGVTVAQQDGPPLALDGPAPTGSWQPGEFLTTIHTLPPPGDGATVLRVGLYDPVTQVRLPVTVAGQAAGDSVALR